MKNKLTDLNDHLFEQMERLNDESLSGDKLKMEIERARSVTGVATQIINNGNLILNAQKAMHKEFGALEANDTTKLLTDTSK